MLMPFCALSDDYPDDAHACITQMCDHMAKEVNQYTSRTVKHYRDGCRIVFDILLKEYPDFLPYTIKLNQIQWLISYLKDNDYAVSTSKGYVQCLRKICKYYHNDVFKDFEIRWPHDVRPHVDWLSEDEAHQLLMVQKTPTQELMLHLELCLGLRRVECARIKLKHIHEGYLDIMGKGPMGGKPRTVPFHPDTQYVLDYYMEYRTKTLESYLKRHRRPIEIPRELMITQKCVAFETDKCTGLDYHMRKLAEKVDFHFSNHTLRRTFGRLMWKANVDIETISKFLGQDDTKVTLAYLGLNFDDMYDAMKLSPFRSR